MHNSNSCIVGRSHCAGINGSKSFTFNCFLHCGHRNVCFLSSATATVLLLVHCDVDDVDNDGDIVVCLTEEADVDVVVVVGVVDGSVKENLLSA